MYVHHCQLLAIFAHFYYYFEIGFTFQLLQLATKKEPTTIVTPLILQHHKRTQCCRVSVSAATMKRYFSGKKCAINCIATWQLTVFTVFRFPLCYKRLQFFLISQMAANSRCWRRKRLLLIFLLLKSFKAVNLKRLMKKVREIDLLELNIVQLTTRNNCSTFFLFHNSKMH